MSSRNHVSNNKSVKQNIDVGEFGSRRETVEQQRQFIKNIKGAFETYEM